MVNNMPEKYSKRVYTRVHTSTVYLYAAEDK